MNSITRKSFDINLKVMKLFALYPPNNLTNLFRFRALSLFFILITIIPILGILDFIFEDNFNLSQIDDSAFLIVQNACQVIKLWPFITNHIRIKKCVHYFDSIIFNFDEENHQEIIKKHVLICRRNSRLYITSIIIAILSFAIKPLLNEEPKLPINIWLPLNVSSDNKIFVTVYAYVVIAVGYTAAASAVIDPLIGGLACLATAQFQILKDNLQNFKTYANQDRRIATDKLSEETVIHNILRKCVDHHNAILEFIAEYEVCFSRSVLSQFAGSILVICFCCLYLSQFEPTSFNFFSVFGYLCIFMIQIYIYCYYGTLLFEESNSLSNAIYMGKWYECDVKIQKSLLILMERSKRPVSVSAGKIFDISVNTFTIILKKSYSLLAVLKNF